MDRFQSDTDPVVFRGHLRQNCVGHQAVIPKILFHCRPYRGTVHHYRKQNVPCKKMLGNLSEMKSKISVTGSGDNFFPDRVKLPNRYPGICLFQNRMIESNRTAYFPDIQRKFGSIFEKNTCQINRCCRVFQTVVHRSNPLGKFTV